MKKYLSLLLCVLMVVFAFASCGGGSSKASTTVIDKDLDTIKGEAKGTVVVVDVYDDSKDDGALLSIGSLDTDADYVTVLRNNLSIKDQVLGMSLAPAAIEKSSYETYYNKMDSAAQIMMDSYYTLIEKGNATDAQSKMYPISADTSIYVLDTSSSASEKSKISGYFEDAGYTAETMFTDLCNTGIVPTPNDLLTAHVVAEDEITTEEVEGGVVITGFTGTAQNIVVPSEIGGKSVVSIAAGAFSLSTIHAVTVADGVKTLSEKAFSNSFGLMNIILADSVNCVEENAFNNTLFTKEADGFVTIGSNEDLVIYYTGSDAEITLPAGVKFIGGGFAAGNKGLTSVTLPDGLISIGPGAFKTCDNLVTCAIPNTVTKICNSAFYEARKLSEITIPDSVVELDDYAFYDAYDSATNAQIKLTLGNGVEKIGSLAFRYVNTTSVVIPDSVKYIGSEAFLKCQILESVTGGKNVEYIGGGAFDETPYFTNIPVDENGFGFFDAAKTLLIKYSGSNADVVIPNTVKGIAGAFNGNKKITSVVINDGCEYISNNAFGYASNLKTVTIPASVNNIDVKAFAEIQNDITVKVTSGSVAETFAKDNHITIG